MPQVKIIGAGSAGNHFAHAFRRKRWDVVLTDSAPQALERTRSETYQSRYGAWDSAIQLVAMADVPKEHYDVVVIATPPASHSALAIRELKDGSPPRILLIEKPLAQPNDPLLKELVALAHSGSTQVLVGYNHNLSPSCQAATGFIRAGKLGEVHSIQVDVREDSRFILNAHPWLGGVEDSYLGLLKEGGGAGFEHSHGMALWCLLAEAAGLWPVARIFASSRLSPDKKFDQATFYSMETTHGGCGGVSQDFLSSPPLKRAEVFGSRGRLTWTNVFKANHEELILATADEIVRQTFAKQRETDFVNEVEHLEKILAGDISDSPVSLRRGLGAYLLLNLGARSAETGRPMSFESPYEL